MKQYGIFICMSTTVFLQAQFELGDEPTFYRTKREDEDVYQRAYEEQLKGSRDIDVLERTRQEEQAAREERERAYEALVPKSAVDYESEYNIAEIRAEEAAASAPASNPAAAVELRLDDIEDIVDEIDRVANRGSQQIFQIRKELEDAKKRLDGIAAGDQQQLDRVRENVQRINQYARSLAKEDLGFAANDLVERKLSSVIINAQDNIGMPGKQTSSFGRWLKRQERKPLPVSSRGEPGYIQARERLEKERANEITFTDVKRKIQNWFNRSDLMPKQQAEGIAEEAAQAAKNIVPTSDAQAAAKRDLEEAAKAADRQKPGWQVQLRNALSSLESTIREGLGRARAQLPSGPFSEWMAAHAGVVGPEAGRDISIKLRDVEPFEQTTKRSASVVAHNYRQLVKTFDNRKKFKDQLNYASILDMLIKNFTEIRDKIQADPNLKRAVTSYVVPLLVRVWKSEDVLIDYINDYLKKLENELMTVQFQGQFQRPPKFASMIGSGS